jgi:hypothetical protein
MKINEAAD